MCKPVVAHTTPTCAGRSASSCARLSPCSQIRSEKFQRQVSENPPPSFPPPLDSCTQIAAGIFPVFKASRALRPDTVRRGKCHELSYWTWMKYPIPSPGEGGAFSATPPTTSRHHATGDPPTPQPCRRPGPAAATETAIALCPPPPALTDKQPPTCRNCPAKYTERTQREPESIANRRFCFNSPLKTNQNRLPRAPFCPRRARQIIRRAFSPCLPAPRPVSPPCRCSSAPPDLVQADERTQEIT